MVALRFVVVVAVAVVASLLVAGSGHAAPELHKPASTPASGKRAWEEQIEHFEHEDREASQKRKHPPVVFLGSSSIRLWESLAQDFPRHQVLNRGFGGSHISDSVHYAERILKPHKPPLVVFYAGTNDIDAGKSPATVAADFRAFTAKVWSLFPATHIAFVSIGPCPARWAQADKVREANRLIAAACAADPKLHFVDVFPDMLGEDGKPKPDLYVGDQLHLSRKGYERWIPRIRETVDKVVPPKSDRTTNNRKAKAKSAN
jgi:lysophospholipase L1-like esterase